MLSSTISSKGFAVAIALLASTTPTAATFYNMRNNAPTLAQGISKQPYYYSSNNVAGRFAAPYNNIQVTKYVRNDAPYASYSTSSNSVRGGSSSSLSNSDRVRSVTSYSSTPSNRAQATATDPSNSPSYGDSTQTLSDGVKQTTVVSSESDSSRPGSNVARTSVTNLSDDHDVTNYKSAGSPDSYSSDAFQSDKKIVYPGVVPGLGVGPGLGVIGGVGANAAVGLGAAVGVGLGVGASVGVGVPGVGAGVGVNAGTVAIPGRLLRTSV